MDVLQFLYLNYRSRALTAQDIMWFAHVIIRTETALLQINEEFPINRLLLKQERGPRSFALGNPKTDLLYEDFKAADSYAHHIQAMEE